MAGKHPVSGDQYRTIDRRMREIMRQLDQGGGSPLDPEQLATALQLILEGDIPSPLFKRDMHKEVAWDLKEEGPAHPASVTKPGDLELITPPIYHDKSGIGGEELQWYAEQHEADLGQRTAEWLLDQRKEIPEEWREYALIFPGSVWRDWDGHRRVPYLGWDGGACKWYLNFGRLDRDFLASCRLVRPRNRFLKLSAL